MSHGWYTCDKCGTYYHEAEGEDCPHGKSSAARTLERELASRATPDIAAVYAWLGYWRAKMPNDAVLGLQDLLGPLSASPSPQTDALTRNALSPFAAASPQTETK